MIVMVNWKLFGMSLLFFFGLNAVFLLLYMVLGPIPAADVFGAIGTDLGGFLTALFAPGGTESLLVESLSGNLYNFFRLEDAGVSLIGNIMMLLWIVVPGTVTAIITGKKFAQESAKAAFWSNVLAVLLLSIIPLIFAVIPALNAAPDGLITTNFVAYMYWVGGSITYGLANYLWVLLAGFLNGVVVGGISAASSTV